LFPENVKGRKHLKVIASFLQTVTVPAKLFTHVSKVAAEKGLHMRERRGYGLKDRRRSAKFHLENSFAVYVIFEFMN
jgi:hypothetical protein